MVDKPRFSPEAAKDGEIRNLRAPKTAEEWCGLYRELCGKEVYGHLNWGNEDEAMMPLTYEEFHAKAMSARINSQDIPLITKADELIRK